MTGFDVRAPTLDDVFLAITGDEPMTDDATSGPASDTDEQTGNATGRASDTEGQVS